jgi:hypothetical protein
LNADDLYEPTGKMGEMIKALYGKKAGSGFRGGLTADIGYNKKPPFDYLYSKGGDLNWDFLYAHIFFE